MTPSRPNLRAKRCTCSPLGHQLPPPHLEVAVTDRGHSGSSIGTLSDMSFAPISSRSRNLSAWFATRPEDFVAERSPKRTWFWGITAAVFAVITVIVLLHPTDIVEMLGGRRRAGMAIAGSFFLPPAIALFSVVMIFVGSRRWRVRGGGVLTNPLVHGVTATFPTDLVVNAIRRGSTDRDGIITALTTAFKHPGDQLLITVWASNTDRVLYVGVLRVDGNRVWIDTEPVRVGPDRFVDLKPVDQAALHAHADSIGKPNTPHA